MTGAKTATASFTLNQYELVASAGIGGTVSGAGTYAHGSVATLIATVDEGYSFAGWTIDGVEVTGGTEISVEMTGAKTATASFTLNQYELVASAGSGGSVSGADTYDHGTFAQLIATADEGYSFAGWTIDGVEVAGGPEMDLEVNGTKSVFASFVLNEYQLTHIPSIGGRIDGGVTYNHGETVIVTALPDIGYSFNYWTLDGVELSSSPSLEIEMTGPKAIFASFTLNQYELVASAGIGGTVSGAGTYDHGSVATLIAIVDEGYSFAGWTIDGAEVAGGSEIDVEMTGAKTATASFTLNQYELITNAGTGGTVSGAGIYEHGSYATLVATANEGYSLAGWTSEDQVLFGGKEILVQMMSDRNISATFALNQYNLTTQSVGGGSIEGNGTYDHGSVASLIATADAGYSFAGWTIDGVAVSDGTEISVEITEAKTATASFTINQYELITNAGTGGTVSGAGTYDYGSFAGILAIPSEGYSFAGWTIDGAEVAGGSEIDVEMTGAKTATASFTLNQYELVSSAGTGGTVSGAGTYDHGSVASLVAIADEGYSFAGWTIDGVEISGGPEISLEMTGAKNAHAVFTLNQYNLIASAGPGGSVSGAGSFETNAIAVLIAIPADGYVFDYWILDGVKMYGTNSLSVVMTSARNATAYFRPVEVIEEVFEEQNQSIAVQPLEIAGVAIDGYLENAEVIFDANGDGESDLINQVFTREDGSFKFLLTVAEIEEFDLNKNGVLDPTEGKIIIRGGIDRSTGSPFSGKLLGDVNTSVVSPLSTLVAQLIEQGVDKVEAQNKVNKAFSIDETIDLGSFDPYAEALSGRKEAKAVLLANHRMANLINQSEALIKSADSNYAEGETGVEMMNAVASQIINSSTNEELDLEKAVSQTFAKMVTDTDFEEKATRLIITADEKQQEAANSESDVEDTMLALLDQQRKVQKQIIERLPSQPNTNGSLSLDDMFTQLDLDASSASKLALLSKPMGQKWHSSTWFGNFMDIGDNWVYHYPLGWLYVSKAEDGYWVWDARENYWWWTTDTLDGTQIFPWIYSDESNGWVYLLLDNNGVKAYDQNSRRWRRRK